MWYGWILVLLWETLRESGVYNDHDSSSLFSPTYRYIYLNHAAEQGRSLVTDKSRNAAAANGPDPRASGKLPPWSFVKALVQMPNMNSRMISLG
ncbi:hypothetical protein N7449_004582 [Penicillium cf. viridicatum]|uniref:Secreted protein n=1 Tax=Penicillium cf. viridicatum TaxID=2972119 RepID=A0A9W9SY48_9EURO|nr:hypothetical protein N7449_004582 [Penicillium cf. viridicatum]